MAVTTNDSELRKTHFGTDPRDLTDYTGPDDRPADKRLSHGQELSDVVGTSTGEGDREVAPGGWEGTDDATSTAISDLSEIPEPKMDEPDAAIGRAFGGGIGEDAGGVTDIKGTPVDGTRDWENEPVIEPVR